MHPTIFIEILFSEEAVFAERKPIVAGENDDGILPLSGLFQRRENSPDMVVEAGHAGVVVGGLLAGIFRRSGPRGQSLVAHSHLAVVPWV